jgi:hypothetical protein
LFTVWLTEPKSCVKNRKILIEKLKTIKYDLMLNGYPKHFIDSITKSGRNNRPHPDTILHGTVVIPCARGISEKYRRIGNRYNIGTIFKTKRTLSGILMTRQDRDAQQIKNVYKYPL